MLKSSCRGLAKTCATFSQPLIGNTQISLSLYSFETQPLQDQTYLLCKSQQKADLATNSASKPIGKKHLSGKEQVEWCVLHKKELQIMCLTDRLRICPHCALFGSHRQHELRTVQQMSQMVKSTMEEWLQCNERKIQLDRKLNSSAFRQAMIGKITVHKNKLVNDIKQKFKELQENLKLAEKRAFDDVAKRFKTVAQRIVVLDKQDQQSHLMYQKWHKTCAQFLQSSSFDTKAIMLAEGGSDIFKEGLPLVKLIEEKAEKKLSTIENLVNSIKVVQNQSVANSIFNYLHIAFQQHQEPAADLTIIRLKTQPQNEERLESMQISSVKIIKDPISPMRYSQKRGGSSSHRNYARTSQKTTNGSNNRKSSEFVSPIKLQTVFAQFCSKQQLDTLDLSNCQLLDSQLYELLSYLKTKKKIKALKLGRNKITSEGFAKILELIPLVANLNLSFNQLTEESISELLRNRHKVPHLRIVNLSSNGLNERRCQTGIQQLKKQGLIVTI